MSGADSSILDTVNSYRSNPQDTVRKCQNQEIPKDNPHLLDEIIKMNKLPENYQEYADLLKRNAELASEIKEITRQNTVLESEIVHLKEKPGDLVILEKELRTLFKKYKQSHY